LKVLTLTWEFKPNVVGGLGKAVTELSPALAAEGIDQYVVTPLIGDALPDEVMVPGGAGAGSLRVFRVKPPAESYPDIYQYAEATNRLMEERAREVIREVGGVDLIHVHDWLAAFSGIAVKHALKLPLITTIHATEYGRHHGHIWSDLSREIHNLEWWLTYEAWRVICCSGFMATEICSAFHVPADKLDVIPNGIDSTPFDAIDPTGLAAFRAGYAHPDEKIIFCVGRIVYEKGAHVLVEAMPKVLAEYPNAKLIITGDGPHRSAVEARALALGIADRVYFTGFVPIDVRNKLFKVADVAVFPSLYEPFGITALEAMVAKTPCVVSNVGGLAEVVTHSETGILAYPDNADSLAWAILHTLNRPDWAQQRAANAYRVATEEYNWRTIARRTIAVYERVVNERKAAVW
jgi:glycosyltransferase involved in cell wall biosynthesis